MTTDSNQLLVLRDGDGNFYLISDDVIQAHLVPSEKRAAVQEALKGDVAGFFFADTIFQNAVTNVGQQNNASANNVVIGALVSGPQTIAQIQGNAANVGTSQTAHT